MEAPIGQSVATSSLPLSQVSPSLTYLIPIFVLLAALCADLARWRPLGWAWCLFVATAVACAGAKSSGLPVLVAGMGLTIVAGLIARRKIYWPAVAGLAALLATMAVGAVAFAGGGASVLKFQALSFLAVLTPYREIARLSPGVIPDDAVVPGLADLDRAGWMFVLLLVAWWLLLQLPRVVGMMVLLRRRTRGDGAVWLLAGALVAGLGGMWMLYHPALSQGYFYLQVVPLGALLTVMLLADALPEDSRTTPIVVGAAAGAGGLAAYFLPVAVPAPLERTYAAWSWALAQPFLVLAVLAIVLGVVWYIARLFFRPLRSHGFAAYLVVLVACSGLGGAILIQESVDLARDDTEYILEIYGSRISADGSRIVTRSEIQAALWLDAHAGEQDVVATNVHCLTPPTKRGCDSRAFWVTGFGGRRAVIEGWGYTDEAVAAHGTNRLGYQVQPPADLERFELNERVFDSPTEEDLRTLRDRYGVRWLLADTDAGKVSPRLVRFARPRMADGPVTIYELPPP
jgi:hypothetical protein